MKFTHSTITIQNGTEADIEFEIENIYMLT